jgi:peptide/nickel transport system substrate-binding protein
MEETIVSDTDYHLVEAALEGQISRRDLITGLLAAGLSLTAVSGILSEVGIEPVDAAPAPAPKRGGTLRVGYQVPATSTDPVTMFNEGAILTAQTALEYLCYPRPNYTLAPKLATSWHASKPDTWTFKLRKGVKWHNGKAFTADDVVYTFNLLTDPASNSAASSAYKGILSKGNIRKVDAHTVTFHLDRGYVDFPYLVSAFTYNSLILPKGYKVGDFIKGNIGTGPYILTKYEPKAGATFKKNPHYWAKGLPYLNGIDLKFYADQQSVALAIQAGALDVYPNIPPGTQKLFSGSNLVILRNPASAYREFHMRVDQAPFNDKRVRQAVALSLDRPKLVKGLLQGFGRLGNDHPFAPVYPLSAITTKIPQRKQNYTQAKKLLAAAGHAKGLSVTLTTENYLEIPNYATVIKQMLAPAGINVTLNVEDQNTYYGSGSNQPWLDVPMGIVDWAPRGVPSQTITPAYLTGAIWNSAHWSNKTYDKLIAQSDKELGKRTREQLVLKAAKIQHDAVPAVIAYWVDDLTVTAKNVHGVPKGPSSYPDFTRTWRS